MTHNYFHIKEKIDKIKTINSNLGCSTNLFYNWAPHISVIMISYKKE